jgi:hypothetical protein
MARRLHPYDEDAMMARRQRHEAERALPDGPVRSEAEEGVAAELDSYRAAAELIEEYGTLACAYVSMEADERLEEGDLVAYSEWKRLLFAIGEMLATPRPAGAAIH